MKHILLTLVLLSFHCVVSAQTLNDVTWITEEYPPYNYTENGQLKGVAVDVLLEVWKRVGVQKTTKDIAVYPWARGLSLMEGNQGTCLFATTITPRRKNVLTYQFVSPIPLDQREIGNHIIALKSKHITITSPEDLKKYRIGVVRGDVGQDFAIEANVPEDHIDACVNGSQLVKKMEKHRFDVASYGFTTMMEILKENDMDPEDYEIVYHFPPVPMGYAFNKDTDPALVNELQKALDAVYADGTADMIMKKYMTQ